MSTYVRCLVLLTLVIGHMNSEVLVVKRHQSCPENSSTECLKGALISFGTKIDPQATPLEIYSEEPNYTCINNNASVRLMSKQQRKADYKLLLRISKDSDQYSTILSDNFEDYTSYKEQQQFCFLHGNWSPAAESETNVYEIYMNFLTSKTMIDKNNLLVFSFTLNKYFSSFKVERKTDTAPGLEQKNQADLDDQNTLGCSGTSLATSITFYLQKHAFVKSNHGTLNMAFFYDQNNLSNNSDAYIKITGSIDNRCTSNAFKTVIPKIKEKPQVQGKKGGPGSSKNRNHLLLIV